MHANITTWLISDIARKSESLQAYLETWDCDSYHRFFRSAATEIVPALRRHGLVSSFAIRTKIDTVTIVSVFENEAGAEAAWSDISGHLHEKLECTLEFLDRSTGPVKDLVELSCTGTRPLR